jgi:IclR family pca regulon transcriptional regulator
MSTDLDTLESGRTTEFVQSLERGLAVLTSFSAEHARMTLSDVARQAGLTRATARRLLHTLDALGYVVSDGRYFELTPRVLDIGYAYLSSLQVGEIALPYMEALSERVHESVSAAVLDGDEIVYVARVPTTRIMRIALALGSRLPALATSMGRVLVADLPPDRRADFLRTARMPAMTERTTTDPALVASILDEVRAQGFALVDQELEDGVRSIAAPLRDRSGRVIAAVNVGTQISRVTMKQLRGEFLPMLLDCAATISAQLTKR